MVLGSGKCMLMRFLKQDYLLPKFVLFEIIADFTFECNSIMLQLLC